MGEPTPGRDGNTLHTDVYHDKESTEQLNSYVNYLFQAYYLTHEEVYAEKMLEILAQLTATEEMLMKISRFYYKAHVGSQENHLYDSHFWQQNMHILFQAAYMLYDKAPYADEIRPMLEYYYELWTARAPRGDGLPAQAHTDLGRPTIEPC